MNQTSPRPRRTSEEWADIVARAESSSLSVQQFCKQHGLNSQTLYGWRKRLRAQAKPLGFVPVVVSRETVSTAARAPSLVEEPRPLSCIEVVLQNGRTVRVTGDLCDESVLQKVLRVVEGQSC